MKIPLLSVAFVAAALTLGGGCIGTFDPNLYRRDAGPGTGDAWVPPPMPLADFCTSSLATVSAQGARTIDTRGLTDDGASDLEGCLGAAPLGPDGFFRLDSAAGQRWHLHYRTTGGTNPALYVLRTCDLRACSSSPVVNLCGDGEDEHLTFETTTAGSYVVGIDSFGAGGLEGTLEVYTPDCGNGIPEHSEGCDDDGTVDGDGCDAECRHEIRGDGVEVEANDDVFGANHVLLEPDTALVVTGRVAKTCEADWFVIDVESTSILTASLGRSDGEICAPTADLPSPFTIELFRADGITRVATQTGNDAQRCPVIAERRLEPGQYFVRVSGARNERFFDYGLRLLLATPPAP